MNESNLLKIEKNLVKNLNPEQKKVKIKKEILLKV